MFIFIYIIYVCLGGLLEWDGAGKPEGQSGLGAPVNLELEHLLAVLGGRGRAQPEHTSLGQTYPNSCKGE